MIIILIAGALLPIYLGVGMVLIGSQVISPVSISALTVGAASWALFLAWIRLKRKRGKV